MSGYSDGRPLQKYWLMDHDTDLVNMAPPVQNTWYEIFHAYDVRLLWCTIYQSNTEAAAKNVEVRWTIDGNVYFVATSLADATFNWIMREFGPSAGGTGGLAVNPNMINAAYTVDKRGLDFKVEVRITSALGTAQNLRCYCVRETLEVT